MRICICYNESEKMKVVNVNGSRYYIQNKDDVIYVIHELIKMGYTITQIANLLGINERTVKRYLSECW